MDIFSVVRTQACKIKLPKKIIVKCAYEYIFQRFSNILEQKGKRHYIIQWKNRSLFARSSYLTLTLRGYLKEKERISNSSQSKNTKNCIFANISHSFSMPMLK